MTGTEFDQIENPVRDDMITNFFGIIFRRMSNPADIVRKYIRKDAAIELTSFRILLILKVWYTMHCIGRAIVQTGRHPFRHFDERLSRTLVTSVMSSSLGELTLLERSIYEILCGDVCDMGDIRA